MTRPAMTVEELIEDLLRENPKDKVRLLIHTSEGVTAEYAEYTNNPGGFVNIIAWERR